MWKSSFSQEKLCLPHSHTFPPYSQLPVGSADIGDKSKLWQITSEYAQKSGSNLWDRRRTQVQGVVLLLGKQKIGCQHPFLCIVGYRQGVEAQKFWEKRDNKCQKVPHRRSEIAWESLERLTIKKKGWQCFIDYAKAFDCVDYNKLWKILKQVGIPDYLTCLLRNLYAGQEATVRTGHGTMDWFQIGKGVCQGCILSPCLFNLYAEYVMRITGLDEAQAGIKIAGRNINNLRYADDPPLWQKAKKN